MFLHPVVFIVIAGMIACLLLFLDIRILIDVYNNILIQRSIPVNSTRLLMDEHRIIEQVLNCLEKFLDVCRTHQTIDQTRSEEFIKFFREFADRCHHGKEEQELFPVLVAKGYGSGSGPVDVMLKEHALGRAQLDAMESAVNSSAEGNTGAVSTYIHNAKSYILLLRNHIIKEDNCLFPVADKALSADEHNRLIAAFNGVDNDDIGSELHQHYLNLANRLAKEYGIQPADADASGR